MLTLRRWLHFSAFVSILVSSFALRAQSTTPPTVTDPVSVNVNAGGTATFTVTTGGFPTPAVQWNVFQGGAWVRFQTCNPTSVQATLTFPYPGCGSGISPAYNGIKLEACVTNAYQVAPVCSLPTTLTVNSPASVSTPSNVTVNAGGTAIFSVLTGGNPAPSIQWNYFSGGSWTPFPACNPTSTQATLAFPVSGCGSALTTANNGMQVQACVSNPYQVAPVCSGTATLTVNSSSSNTAPTVSNPANVGANVGGTAQFSVVTGGSPAPTIQWQVFQGGGWAPFQLSNPTSTTPNLSFTVTSPAYNNVQLRACVSNSDPSSPVCSSPAKLTVNTAPTVSNPANLTVNVGGTAIFAVTTGGAPSPTIQWNYLSGAVWVPFPACNPTGVQAALVFPVAGCAAPVSTIATTNTGLQVQACVSNAYQATPVCSSPATLTVDSAPTVSNPSNTSVSLNANAMFSVTIGGTPTPTVQWQVFQAGSWVAFETTNPTSTTPNLVFPAVVPAFNNIQLRACVTNSFQAAAVCSSPATLKVLTAVTVSPNSLIFPAQVEGTTSAARSVTVTNNQAVPLNFAGVTFTGANSGDFAQTNNCTTVAASLNCTVSVTFTPSGPGTRTAFLNIADDATGSPQSIVLTGVGNLPVTVLPGAITNFTAPVGTISPFQTITITNNNAAAALNISGFQFMGDFQQTSTTCGASLAALASCNVTVSFAPTIGGTRTGQLQINDDAITSPQVVNLSGAGTSPLTISTSALTYGAQKLGTLSPSQTVLLTNHESQPETFTLNVTGNFTASSNCSSGSIAANSTCMISVVFAPAPLANAGPLSGSLTIGHSAAVGSPLGVSLTGSASTDNPPAAVAVVSPGAGSAGTVVPVIITGNTWTHFSASSVITFTDTDNPSIPSDITVSIPNPGLITANQIPAQLTIGANSVGNPVTFGARNISVATPLAAGGTETAQLNSAFIIADPSNAHTVTSAAPAFGTQGQNLNVTLTASGTHFIQGTTYANFGDGITINSLSIIDAIHAQANITISNTTPIGYRMITMVTGGEFATSGSTIFQIGPNSAKLLTVFPNSEGQGWSGQVYLTASGTHFLQDATQVSIGGGVIVGNVKVTSLGAATVQVAVPPNATPGLQDVTVSTGGEIATLGNAFSVISTTPYLTSVSPSSGVQGQTLNIDIKGVNTNFSQVAPATMLADLTGLITVNSITVNSPTDVVLNVTVNQVANVGSITARLTSVDALGNATIFPFTFTVTASAASIVSVTPGSVAQGAQVSLNVTGLNTIWNQATTQAAFYPEPYGTPIVNQITINSPTSAVLNITVPTGTSPGTYGFYMATGGQVVSSSITVYANTPSVTMNPANGLPGQTLSVSFNGQFTNFGQGTTLPVISGQGVTISNFTVNSPVSATATVTIASTAATTSRLVTLTTGNQIVTTYFNVTSTPVGIISVAPYHAAQNVTLDVAIVGLNTHFAPNTTTVLFGPQFTVNSVTVTDATHLTANITTSYLYNGVTTASPIGWEQVYVNTGAEMVIGGFSVDAPASPTLLSVTPSSAAQGSTANVTIRGSLTNWVNGTTQAILGAGVTVANLTITSPTTATATISVSPTAPVGGNSVTMITGSEIVGGTGFSVTPSAASIVRVGPAVKCDSDLATFVQGCGGSSSPVWVVAQTHTSTLNVVGLGTHWLQGETTFSFGGGVIVDSLTINSPTTATVQITVLSNSPVGYASLTTYTDGEVVTLQQAIDIEQGYPTLLAMTPTAGAQGATLTVQVLGRFTHWQTGGVTNVAFNQDIKVNSINVIDDSNLTANITVSPWAYVDYGPCGHVLTVTTGNEQVSTAPILDNFCVQQGAAQINSVSSVSGAQGTTATVTITGSATNFLAGVTTVSFGDPNFQVGQITVNSPTSLTASVAISTAATPGYKTVTVATYGEIASRQYAFTVVPNQATLTEANPYQQQQGVQNVDIVLTGQYSHFSNLSTATFGPGIVVNSVTFNSQTQVTANISIDPLSYTGGRTVTVTTPGVACSLMVSDTRNACPGGATTGTGSEIVSYSAFSIIPGPAIISQVTPNTGNEGQEVVFQITGANTHWAQNFTQFYIAGGGSDLTINSVIINSATSATVDMSISTTANPGTRSIFMVTAGESLTDSGAFVVTGGVPVVTYISPNSAIPGTNQLGVTINGLYTKWDSTTTVNFGPGVTVTAFQVEDNTHIQAVLNIDPAAQIGYRTVVVATGAQGLTGNFQVTAPAPPPTPYIWYYWPSSGLPGQTFTIHFAGQNTHWDPNPITGTQATFGSGIQVNTFQVTGATSAIANITITATQAQSNLIVFTTGTETESVGFNVVVSQPTLSIVDPGSGLQGATNLTVNILGQYTTFDNTTTFSFGPGITVNGPPTILGPTIATQSISIDQLATLGGRSVTATTGAQVVGGAGFSVTPSLALISAVTPNTAKQGDTVTVEVTGMNTHWSGSTVFSFGDGISVTSTTVNSATDATLTLSIPALASIGTTDARAQTLGEVAYISHGFVVQVGTPLLLSSGPGSLPQQSTAIFTILSQATTWSAANPPTVSMGPGVVITNVQVTGPTSMTVNGFVQPTTYVGYRDLTVSTGTQTLSLPYAFYVRQGPAVINSITPSSGGQNVNVPLVQIVGTNTHWQQGVTTLSFPSVLVNSFTVNSPVSISANITPNINAVAGQVSVTATTLGEVATVVNGFTIIQTQPQLLAAVPTSGPQGKTQNVVLTGLYTHFDNTSVVSFGAGITVNTVNAPTSTSITANITISPTAVTGTRNVSVVTGSETVQLTNGFNITTGPAAILSLSPATGSQGSSMTVQVTGSQTNFAQGVTQAVFYGGISVTGVTVVDALHANVNITIPSYTALGSYNVVLATGGESATILGGFTVTSGSAQLTTINPPTGTQGSSNLNVNLTGLFTHFVNGTSVANFGAGIAVNSTTVSSTTTAVANISISPAAALGSRTVTVTTGGESAPITGGFTVLAGIPTLLSAAPGTGQAGTTLSTTITGQFTAFTASSTVSFGDGIGVNFVNFSDATHLIANITIPSNASVGNTYVSVATGAQTLTLNNYFSVTPGTPVIKVINPNIGNPSQTLSVTITGQYTNWVNGTTTASFGPAISVGGAAAGVSGPVTVNSPTSLTASITIPANATLGPVDVITTTGGEVENIPAGFTVQAAVIPAPSLISLSPGANAGGMPINSNIIAVFSQPMKRTTINSSTVILNLASNPSGWVTVPGTVNLDATGRIMTFTPNSLLAVNATYYLQMTNAIQDATGNTFNSYNQYLYTTFSANVSAPVVVAANPPANSTVGTNVAVQLDFSADMNQFTQSGMTVMASGTPVAGTFSWNSNPYGSGGWGPGTILTFTPSAPLAPGTTYTVSYGSPLADTAGNLLTPGSFTFNTGAAADTAQNYSSTNLQSYQGNIGTNIAPVMTYSKPINPININTSTVQLYNGDSGKYIGGTVTLAPNGLSATFTPNVPLLPDTLYYFHQSGGNYDADGNYLSGNNFYFITGAGQDLNPPQVASVSPANLASSVPLNAEVVVRFDSPINPSNVNVITVTPSGGSPISGTATLASDLVTLTFVPSGYLQSSKLYNVQVSGYSDVVGNFGAAFNSTFTTAASSVVLNVSTGLDASGNLITTGNTADGHWVVVPTATTPSESTFTAAGTAQPLLVAAPGNAGYYSGWLANGPTSSWVTINPNSTTGNTHGVYSTTFNISGGSVPPNLCLVGGMGVDDNGLLGLNGVAIMGNINTYSSLTSINIPISSHLVLGANTLALGWGSTDNSDEAFRLSAVIETCGASVSGGLSLSSAVPSYAATGVATNTSITLNFNNPINPLTVNSTTLPVMVNWNSNQELAGTYVVNGNQVVFTPDSPFPTNTQIWVGACGGPNDLAGDSAGGCYTQLTYFTTGSTATAAPSPFQVTAFSPAANATNVGLRAPVAATFNRSVDLNTLNQYDFGLFAGATQSPWCTSYSHSQDDTTVQFNCYALPSSTVMTATLGSNITDWQGNALTPFTSQFTTSGYDSNTNGTVSSTRPGNGASGIDPNQPLTLFTNLPIDPATASNGIQVAQNNAAITGTVQVVAGGYALVFTPSTPFTPGALIQWWTTGGLSNSTYNTPINAASGYFYVAASTSTLAPTVQVASPPAYTSPVPQNTVFDIQFNTPLNPSTVTPTNIYLYDSTTGLHPAVTYSQPQPNVVRMVPTADLPANHYIYVYVTTGLQSTTSVPASSTSWYEYTGSPDDSTLPVVVSAVPFNGASNVGVNVTPGVVLSKPVDPTTVNSSTFQVKQGGTPLAGSYWFSSNNTRVQFMPNAPLPASTTLTMAINGIADQEGHPIAYSSSFQTGAGSDFVTPSILWTSIPNNGVIPINSMVKIQFSESMDLTTFTSNNIRIYDSLLGTNVASTLSWSIDQSAAFLLPSAPLAAGRTYYLYVNGGTDLAGNTVSGYFAQFSTTYSNATTAPSVIKFNPSNGQTGVGTNTVIEAQFSAPIDANTLAGVTLKIGGSTVTTTPVLSAGNTILQLVPQAPLVPNTAYVMTIAGVKDPAGNLVSTTTDTFTTGATYDITAATVVTYNPPNYSTTGTNVTPVIEFNKALNPITVSGSTFYLYLYDTGQQILVNVTMSADGRTVTLTPQAPLLPNREYRFAAGSGLQDINGNGLSAGSFYFYTGSGLITTGPTVSVSPLNGATGIPLNAHVLVSTTVPISSINWNQNSIHVVDSSSNPVAGTVSMTNSQTLSFAPTANLAPNTVYTITASGFTDTVGNPIVPYTGTFTTGSLAASGGLTLVGTNITNGSTVTNNMQPIILTFSQILNPATVSSTTLEVMKGWNSNYGLAGTYTVSGNQVTFTPTSPYPAGATIYVGECGGPTDVLGEVFYNGNCWQQQLVYFTMSTASPDTSPFQVVSVSPANGATNVGRDQTVAITFNKSANPGSAASYNAQLYAGQTLQNAGSVSWSADDRTMYFNVGALNSGTVYSIALPAGGLTDMSGNALASTFSSTFTTVSDPATCCGTVVNTTPGNGATGVPTNSLLTLYVNRPVNPSTLANNVVVTVNGQVYAGTPTAAASGYEVQFTPTVPFPAGATVQWWFSNVQDLYGNILNGTSGYFYTVAAVDPSTAQPVIVAVSPQCCGSNTLPTNTDVDVQYSQPLNAATVTNANFYQNTGPAVSYTVSLVSPTVVRIIPTAPFAASTQYGFCANGSVKGTNGVAAQNSCWLTYFTTTTGPDNAAGTVTIGPPNGSVSVGTNGYIRLQFSKPADRTTVNSSNIQITVGATPIPGSWTYNFSGSDLVGANFYPLNPLPPSSTIQVAVSNILDYAGNTFTSATSQFTTDALPDYDAPSVALDFNYWQTGVGTNATFACRYGEPMDPSSITTANNYIYSYSAGARIPVTVSVTPDMLSATIIPTAPLTANSQFVYYCQNAIDLTGNAQSNGSAGFYTSSGPVLTGPTLLQANPPNGFTNVPVNTNQGPWASSSLGLQFSEPVSGNSLGNITLTPNGGSPIPIAVYPENGNTFAWVQLPWALLPNTTYTYNVTGVTDISGNTMTPVTSTFTTGSSFNFTNPTVTVASPANGATSVLTTAIASVTFSTAMNPVLIDTNHIYLRTHNTQTLVPATLTVSSDSKTVTLTPTAPLTSATIYDLVTTSPNWYLTDIAGNPYYSTGVVSTFTTQ